jgi:hypothetical protein
LLGRTLPPRTRISFDAKGVLLSAHLPEG